MRALFLLVVLLLAGCGSDLRTYPVTRATSAIPKPTTPPEDSVTTTGKELDNADFSRSTPTSLTWRKGTPQGGIIVTLSQVNGVTATVQYNRTDGSVHCKMNGPGLLLVHQIQRQDLIPTAAQLIAEHGCTPV